MAFEKKKEWRKSHMKPLMFLSSSSCSSSSTFNSSKSQFANQMIHSLQLCQLCHENQPLLQLEVLSKHRLSTCEDWISRFVKQLRKCLLDFSYKRDSIASAKGTEILQESGKNCIIK